MISICASREGCSGNGVRVDGARPTSSSPATTTYRFIRVWQLLSHTQPRFRRVRPHESGQGYFEAAKDEYSTYLHLVVCMLELDALRQLLGEDRALEVIAARPYYKWVYRQVLYDDDPICDVLERHGLALP
jgi:hypothetical protein